MMQYIHDHYREGIFLRSQQSWRENDIRDYGVVFGFEAVKDAAVDENATASGQFYSLRAYKTDSDAFCDTFHFALLFTSHCFSLRIAFHFALLFI